MEDLVHVGFLWKKSGCLRQKISSGLIIKREAANVNIVAGTMLFLILVLTIFFGFRMTQYMVTAAGVEDALAASNLASAVIDLEEYGKNHRIYISDEKKAYQMFREALECNLNLDNDLNTTNNDFLVGKVSIKDYRIYNVRDHLVDILIFDSLGEITSYTIGNIGEVFTPDNVCVENTTIYSKIGFQVEGLAGREFVGEKEKSIDIVRCDSE